MSNRAADDFSGIRTAAIVGCSGTVLSDDERDFFSKSRPLGFILFARNIETPDQVSTLVQSLRDAVGDPEAPVLIDQEGGRVRRLRPPHWTETPPMAPFGALYRDDEDAAHRALQLDTAVIASELRSLGIDVDCAPVLDVPDPEGHDIIGDRAFSDDPAVVSALGRTVIDTFLANGVLPIAKHVPGHGRAKSDSHLELPRVSADRDALTDRDFVPFKALSDCPLGMTAHIVFEAFDPELPATLSRTVVGEVIRGEIGFDGLLMTDDLSMKALSGDFAERAARSIEAGCDVVLHCNGDMAEMAPACEGAGKMSGAAARRWSAARARLSDDGAPVDCASAIREVEALLAGYR